MPHDDSPSPLRHRQVGVGASSLHVVEAGDPATPPVLLVHGWPQSSYAWRHVMAAGAQGAYLLAVDLPGTGGSTGEATDGSKQQIAALLHQLVEQLGPEDLTLVGHDSRPAVLRRLT